MIETKVNIKPNKIAAKIGNYKLNFEILVGHRENCSGIHCFESAVICFN